jgi:hypothetical protein
VPLSQADLDRKILNRGLDNITIARYVNDARCPKCWNKLHVNFEEMTWAGCLCCKVEYARGEDGAVFSRYEPNGRPHCKHYD